MYLKFNELPKDPSKKTYTIDVLSTKGDFRLGCIKWMPTWRKYTFWPESDSIFDAGCLQEIIRELNIRNDQHKTK